MIKYDSIHAESLLSIGMYTTATVSSECLKRIHVSCTFPCIASIFSGLNQKNLIVTL